MVGYLIPLLFYLIPAKAGIQVAECGFQLQHLLPEWGQHMIILVLNCFCITSSIVF